MDTIKELEDFPLFENLPPDDRACFAETLRLLNVPADSLICREGEPGKAFYIIRRGEVEVVKNIGTSDEKILFRLVTGDYFGEMSLLSPGGVRNACVRAVTDVQLWEMAREDFNDLMHHYPASAYEILRTLSQRVNQSQNKIIEDLRLKNEALEEAYQALKAAQAQIIEKEKLESELRVAREIQISLLPDDCPSFEWFDLGATIQPAREVGGDLYNFILLDENRIGILIGDVTDKGVPAAIFMAQVQALFRALASQYASLREVMLTVNRLLLENNEQGYFVTALYGVLNKKDGIFEYIRAGHEVPILWSSHGKADLLPKKLGQPLGILEEPILDENKITISPGGALLLYTDGLTDEDNEMDVQFRETGLMQAVCDCSESSAQEICDHLLQTVIEHRNGKPLQDDVAMVVIKRKM
jgi:sigma-B regulation protein RsbU (phosphoserine phosphatase)